MTREFLYGMIREAIQIGAGAVGWFLLVELEEIDLGDIGFFISWVLVCVVLVGLEVVRERRFTKLYALLTRRESFTRYLLPGILLGVIIAVILFPLGFYTRMNFDQPLYILVLIFPLWPEIWLAHKRYRAN